MLSLGCHPFRLTMLKRLSTLALTLALATPLSTAKAVGNTSYDVCGGSYASWSGFAFCASVNIAVVQKSSSVWNVAISIANMSGLLGSYAGSFFTAIGIDNIPGHLANPANIVVSQNGVPVCTNTLNSQSPSLNCWKVQEDANASGNINVDFLDQSSNGIVRDISSLCGTDQVFLYTCLASHPVTLSFDINYNWNPATSGQVYIQSVSLLGLDECETGTVVTRAERCSNVTFPTSAAVTATPEPATLGLMGTGLFALGPIMRRRRKKESDATTV